MNQQSVTRRRFLRRFGALAGLAAAGVLGACNVPTATPPTPKPAAPAQPTAAPQPTAAAQKPAAPAAQPAATAAKPAAAAQPATAPTQAAPAKTAGTGFKWDRFKGTQVRMIWTDLKPVIGGLQPHFKEFEELTGMKLVYEGYATAQMRQKMTIELVAKEPGLDSYGMQVSQQGRQHWESGWIEPLDKYIDDKELTNPEWDLEDFGAGARSANQIPSEGATTKSVALATAQCQVFYYRENLLKEAGIPVPKTHQEMLEAAKALNKPDKGYNGIVMRGGGKWATTQIGTYLYGMGGRWIGDDGRIAIDTPEMGKTLEFYGGLLREYGPPGASNLDDRAVAAAYQQGQAAMMTDLNHFQLVFNDPAQSPKIAGQVRVTYIPRGPVEGPVPGGHFIMLPVQNVAMSPFSRNKEATWLWLQWLTSKQSFVYRQMEGNSSPRVSTWKDKEFLQTPNAKANPDWVELSIGANQYGRNWVSPPILAVDEFRDIMAKAIDAVVLGQGSTDAVLKEVQAEADALMERTEPAGKKVVDWSKLR
ncbi:MAG: extracellular solute-binding protein [Chloroflexi bacterium]|nr:extracellular solute-binding protein [Chloroflexota bacterium]